MGSMADLNLASTRQENQALRQELQRLSMVIEAMRATDRLNALRAQFVAASLQAGEGVDDSLHTGFYAAEKFVERLMAEAKENSDDGTSDPDGDHRHPVVAAEVGEDGK